MNSFVQKLELKRVARWFLYLIIFLAFLLFLPKIYSYKLQNHKPRLPSSEIVQFPVTVDPLRKQIVENEAVNAYLSSANSPLQASVISTLDSFLNIFKWLATAISELPLYQSLSFVGSSRIVHITPGLRKEEVANSFGSALGWTAEQKHMFLKRNATSTLPLAEGSFTEGDYSVEAGMSPQVVQGIVNTHFTEEVLLHYGTSTASVVPLNTALTIASLIERETINNENARLVSGIIWNRIFLNMNLQLDASLQYVKASGQVTKKWWPKVASKDKYLKSPYNTYMHPGLPPTPIASPSVAAIVSALNPVKTSCLFYFNDDRGDFHCSDTYEQHVVLLKKYFGRGR